MVVLAILVLIWFGVFLLLVSHKWWLGLIYLIASAAIGVYVYKENQKQEEDKNGGNESCNSVTPGTKNEYRGL